MSDIIDALQRDYGHDPHVLIGAMRGAIGQLERDLAAARRNALEEAATHVLRYREATHPLKIAEDIRALGSAR